MSDSFNTAVACFRYDASVNSSQPITPSSLMKRFLSAFFAPFCLLVTFAIAADAPGKNSVAQLAFLTGHWRGTSSTGAIAEELISSPEGGVMLSTGREFQGGKCIFFDLVAFTEKDGAVTLIPHPNGKRSPHTFPLASLDVAAKRAAFENKEHDFPKTFVYELVAPDRLRITLTGEMKGQPATEVYNLTRTK